MVSTLEALERYPVPPSTAKLMWGLTQQKHAKSARERIFNPQLPP